MAEHEDFPDKTYKSLEKMDYNERLQQLKQMIDEGNEAVMEINENLKFIDENSHLLKELDFLDPNAAYMPLEYSKQREFVECVKMIIDVCKHLNQHKACQNSHSHLALKTMLYEEELAGRNNDQVLRLIENCVEELSCFYNTSKPAITRDL